MRTEIRSRNIRTIYWCSEGNKYFVLVNNTWDYSKHYNTHSHPLEVSFPLQISPINILQKYQSKHNSKVKTRFTYKCFQSREQLYIHKCPFVCSFFRLSVSDRNPSTAWNHHPSSFIFLHHSSLFYLHFATLKLFSLFTHINKKIFYTSKK